MTTPDWSIYLESADSTPHRWTLWVDGQPTQFEREFDLYAAIDIATAYLEGKGITAEWHGPVPPDYSRYYACRR